MNNNLLDIMIFIKEIQSKEKIKFINFKILDYIFSKNKKEIVLLINNNKKLNIDISNYIKNLNINILDNFINKNLKFNEIDNNLQELKEIIKEVFEQINNEINNFYIDDIKKQEILNEVVKNIREFKNNNKDILINKEIIYKFLLQATMALKSDNIDELTKLYNGRFFKFLSEGNRLDDKKLKEQLLTNLKTNNKELYLFFIDLNNFKIINDEFGHDIGDKVLINFSNNLKKLTTINNKNKGIVIRKSGDEFILIVNKLQAKKIIKEISSKKFIDKINDIIPTNKIITSISFGISKINNNNLKNATIKADEKLKISKPIFHYLLDNNDKIRHKKVSKNEFKKCSKIFLKDLKTEFNINELKIYNTILKDFNLKNNNIDK